MAEALEDSVMMRHRPFAKFLLLSAFALSAVAAGGIVHSAPPPPIVDRRASGEVLEWAPLASHESAVLAVSDPYGEVRTRRFGPGSVPSLSLLATDGLPIPDGLYTWEIRMTARDEGGKAKPLVESGHFRIAEGRLVPFDLEEPPEGGGKTPASRKLGSITAPDQMLPDDLIVDGKGCIGLGCVNNEAFGAETLRLKQAAVRLRFEDTSSQPGFAARDWQLTANETGSSGADKFMLEDLTAGTKPFTVMGGAPTNSLFVSSSGAVGIGTAAPVYKLQVASSGTGTSSAAISVSENNVRQWILGAGTNNSGKFGIINGSTLLDALTIDGSNNVGIGTTAPANLLTVSKGFNGGGNGGIIMRVEGSNVSDHNYTLFEAGHGAGRSFVVQPDGDVGIGVSDPQHPLHFASGAHVNVNGVFVSPPSSRDQKRDIQELSEEAALVAVRALAPVTFRYLRDSSEVYVGFIAEDVPKLVAMSDRKALVAMDIVAVLTKVVQAQGKRLIELRSEVEALKKAVGANDD